MRYCMAQRLWLREIKRKEMEHAYLERTVRMRKGFLEMTEMKREREGPNATRA